MPQTANMNSTLESFVNEMPNGVCEYGVKGMTKCTREHGQALADAIMGVLIERIQQEEKFPGQYLQTVKVQ